jgi:aryl carrier-like protein
MMALVVAALIHKAEVERLNAELARATRDRALDSIRIRKLKGQLRQSEAALQNYEQMIDNMF